MKTFWTVFVMLLIASQGCCGQSLEAASFEAYLKSVNPEAQDQFGWSVAVSGDTAVVGARFEDSAVPGINQGGGQLADNTSFAGGAAYVFVRLNGVWSFQAYLKPAVTQAGANFGSAVAISGNTIAVGAPGDNSSTTGINSTPNVTSASTGAVHVFVRNAGVWSQQAYIKADAVRFFDELGKSVALDGDLLVAGAPGEDTSIGGVNPPRDVLLSDAGAAFVFRRNGTVWEQEAMLKASNPGMDDDFGTSVGVSGNVIVVGSPFEDSGSPGVNAPSDEAVSAAGAAYVFARGDSGWAQQAYLKASNPGEDHRFGAAVSVSLEAVLVGAERESSATSGVNSTPDTLGFRRGAAYVFRRSGTAWAQEAYFKASNSGDSDWFGGTVSLWGDLAVVGAWVEDSSGTGVNSVPDNAGTNSGAAYVFERNAGVWAQRAFLKASNTGANDFFARSLCLQDRTVIVGAPFEQGSGVGVNPGNDNASDAAGAAYVFEVPAPPPPLTLAHTNYRVPGEVDLFFGTAGNAALNGTGRLLFETAVSGAGAARGRNRLVLSTLSPEGTVGTVLQRGQSLTGVAGYPAGATVSAVTGLVMNQAQRGALVATVAGRGVTAQANRLILTDDGETVQPLLRTGVPLTALGGASLATLGELLQHQTEDALVVPYTLRRNPAAGVAANNDSGLLVVNHAGQARSFSAREGGTSFGGEGLFGQFPGRAAFATGEFVFFIAPFVPTGERRAKQAMFYCKADGTAADRYSPAQGDPAPGALNNEVVNLMVGINERDGLALLRATMKNAPASRNEGLFNCGSVLLLQKGVAFESDEVSGVFVTRILGFWPVDAGQLVVRAALGGTDVRGTNNQALLLRKADGKWQVLIRSGQPAPGVPGATVGAIAAVEVDRLNGHYAVLGTLKGVRGTANQALWRGRTTLGDDVTGQSARLPGLLMQKGAQYASTITPGGAIRGLALRPVVDKAGAGGRGQAQVVGATGHVVITVLGDRKIQEVLRLNAPF